MTTIRALQNFGFKGENIPAGTVIEADPDDFGGTYKDHISAGLIEEVKPEPVADVTAPADEPAQDSPPPAAPGPKGKQKAS